MKKFFGKPHNLLFTASAVILLQFLAFVIYYFMQAVAYQEVNDLIYVFYIPYCLAVCVIAGIFILKKPNENAKNLNSVKLWFSGLFLYAFCEILIYVKLLIEYRNENMESAMNLFDNQLLYKLYLCISVVFLLYCAFYVLEKKKIYAVFAGINLLLFALFMILLPDMSEFLLAGDESSLEVIGIICVREIGTVTLMLNMFVFGLCEFYNYKEK